MAEPQVATADIAYACSNVIYTIEPAPPVLGKYHTNFTTEIARREQEKAKNIFGEIPKVHVLLANSDPFSKIHAENASGALVSVLTTAKTLIPAIPHLYKIANEKSGLVIHVAVDLNPTNNLADYSDVMAVRQTGFALLKSNGGQETMDVALIAHALAIKTGVPVLHFFDKHLSRLLVSSASSISSISSRRSSDPDKHDKHERLTYFGHDIIKLIIHETDVVKYRESRKAISDQKDNPKEIYFRSVDELTLNNNNSNNDNNNENENFDYFKIADQVFKLFERNSARSYHAIEFSGDQEADSLLITLGSGPVAFQQAIQQGIQFHSNLKVAIIKIRLYRPWSDQYFLNVIPKSVRKVAVLEQISKRTIQWTPVYLDVTAAFQNSDSWSGEIPSIFGGSFGSLDERSLDSAIYAVFDNLSLNDPLRDFNFDKYQSSSKDTNGISYGVEPKSILEPPTLETSYFNMLKELFADRLYVANAISESTVGHLESIKSTPEFGFGVLLAKLQNRAQFSELVSKVVKDVSLTLPEDLHSALSQWILHKDDSNLSSIHSQKAIELLSDSKLRESHPFLKEIYDHKDQFVKPAQWLIGSDAWSYDIGFSGVHHVVSSGKDINLLIIDSQPYDPYKVDDPEKRKKDIGLYAMNYGDVYVASIAVYSSYTQALHAILEAEKFKGPSVVLAYLPYEKVNDTTITVLKNTKQAVDSGYWPLYRWNPALEKEGKEPFSLDSERIKQELQAFLDRENHLTQLVRANPELATTLASSLESEIAFRQKARAKSAYEKLLGGLTGPPLLILFGSDGGNAEGVARKLLKGALDRGYNAKCMAMDDCPFEDLTTVQNLVIVCCTAGQGEFPHNGREFWKYISSATDISLSETLFSVFGLGDSHYWPRKEDEIYYNKPGKDLNARLKLLGAKQITPLGLGDDQDPDGYETELQLWEPMLWKALKMDHPAEERLKILEEEWEKIKVPKVIKTDDDAKIESNYLRGTIAKGLEDTSTGALSEADTKLTKFHGIYQQDDRDLRQERMAQGLEKAYMFMARVRVPGGVSTSQQWLAIDEIADKWANGTIKLTTRQAFQLHGVLKRNLKSTIRGINKSLLDTLAACGDVNRNIMCNPNPFLSEIHEEVYEFAKKLSAHLSPKTSAYHEIWLDDKLVAGQAVQDVEPLYGPTYLPRKFKIAIAIPPNNDVDVFAHDVGFIAITDENDKLAGYNVSVGGGMGMTHKNNLTYPRLGDIIGFCLPEQAIDVAEKIMLVQRDFGDRTNRKHARLKYTIDDRSVEWFINELESRLGYKLQKSREFQFENNADRYGWTRGVNNTWHFCMYIENGRVKDSPEARIKTGLKEIANLHKCDFRLTPNQHLIIGNVAEQDKLQIQELLQKYKLDNLQYTGLRLNSMACVSLPTCGLGLAESERYLPSLVSKLETIIEEAGLRNDAITIRMTGCPNGCARPYVAEIAFVGTEPETYNVYLGGGFNGQRLNKLYKENLKEEEIFKVLIPILHRYAKERLTDEKFGDFVIRMGYVKPTTS
ncbi:1320_t:CDS:1, partial [Ambispora leptoticha]